MPNSGTMHWLFATTIHLLLATLLVAQTTDEFRDDFNGNQLNSTKWNMGINGKPALPENLKVQNGFLTIVPGAKSGTSLDTQKKYTFRYGEVEWRAKLAGPGGTSVFVLAIDETSTEPSCRHDTVGEIYPVRYKGDFSNKVITGARNGIGEKPRKEHTGPDFSADFHLFKVAVAPNSLTFFIDGKEVHRITEEQSMPKCPLFPFMLAGGKSSSPTIIDYIRISRGWSETYDV